MFVNKIYELTRIFIPQKLIPVSSSAPWYNTYLKRLSNKKKRLFRGAKLQDTDERWRAYESATQAYSLAVSDAKANFLSNTLPAMLVNKATKLWKIVTNTNNSEIVLVDTDGLPVPARKCEHF